MKSLKTVLLFTLFFSLAAHAQVFKKYDKGSFIEGRDSIYYRILFPEHFDPKQKYPIVFLLHGSGERGNDNEKQLLNGGKLFLKPEVRKQFPAIVVFPQCETNGLWANVQITTDSTGQRNFNFLTGGAPTKAMHALLGMVDNLLDKPYVNKKQAYIGGLSMGAMGTYEILRRKPKTFAAAFAICGGDNVANVNKYKKVPIWIFHGGRDNVVPPVFSKTLADQMKIIGKEVKYSFYPDDSHNSWDSAFAEPQLLSWLFSHQK
jgi:predicted peptidase